VIIPLLFAVVTAVAQSPATHRPTAGVTVAQILASPVRWDGRRVRIAGLAAREFENNRLFDSYEDYCALGEPDFHREGLRLNWDGAHLRPGRFRRMAVIEGVFHNTPMISNAPDGTQIITIGGGPGLTDLRVVRWTSAPLTRCGDPRE